MGLKTAMTISSLDNEHEVLSLEFKQPDYSKKQLLDRKVSQSRTRVKKNNGGEYKLHKSYNKTKRRKAHEEIKLTNQKRDRENKILSALKPYAVVIETLDLRT